MSPGVQATYFTTCGLPYPLHNLMLQGVGGVIVSFVSIPMIPYHKSSRTFNGQHGIPKMLDKRTTVGARDMTPICYPQKSWD